MIPAPAKDFRFDPLTHTYYLGDQILTSVTQALKGAGVIDHTGIGPAVLEYARNRGIAVHAACQYHDEGALDWRTVDQEIMGYVDAWIKFKKESGIEILAIEKAHHHPLGLYAGTIDRIIKLNGQEGVLDLKTYEVADWTALQLAGYAEMIRDLALAPMARWGLWLKPDGNYKLRQFQDKNDIRVFLACLTISTWRANHK